MTPATSTPDAADRRFYSTRRSRRAVRRAEQQEHPTEAEPTEEMLAWQEPDAGHPLGHGMPTGSPLRHDTESESHLEAWKGILRADPCAFCGRRMLPCTWTPTGSTVDHIVPRSDGTRFRERWTNFTGCCLSCNGSKSSQPLLLWITRRPLSCPVRKRLTSDTSLLT